MGYKLYASMGTADFYTEHGLDVSLPYFYAILFILSTWVIALSAMFVRRLNQSNGLSRA